MRCLIVDDESLARRELRQLLSAHPGVEIAGEAENVDTALELAALHRPDAVFLDVQLRGENGFDFVGRAEPPLPAVVFVTAHDRYAVRGFECNALDYLLKPVRPERLAETLERVRRNAPPVRRRAEAGDAVFLKVNDTACFVPWRAILRIASEGNYSRVYREGGPCSPVLRPLKEWLALAPEGLFLQVHRSTLVRRDAIREIAFEGDGKHRLTLSDGSVVPVGRAYWPGVKALIKP